MTSSYQPIELRELEDKLDLLIERFHAMQQENLLLKSQKEVLIFEKAQLVEKTTLARTRIEAMIERLKEMEQGT
ncbi:MAG: TIGR02449 family protein [Methylococcaceae bacterium]